MTMRARFRFFALLLVLIEAGVSAQTSQKPLAQMPASARQLIAIKVIGSKRYPEAAIAAATSLQIGTPASEDDFKRAALRLGNTGAFTDVAFNYSYSSAGTKLELHVTEAEKFVPAHFEDFVWFSETELRQRIREHVPLFDGQLPLSGRMADDVSDVLQAMLVERGIPGHVDYLRYSKGDGPVEAINYKVSEVLVRVRNIEFSGAGAAELPALDAAAKNLTNREYSRSLLEQFAQRELLPIYQARGYLKASFGEPEPKPVNQPTSDIEENPRNRTVVDVEFAVAPGQQYKLKSLEWSGNEQFPTETLQKMLQAQVGRPANSVQLTDDFKAIQELYGSRGFITAALRADANFDDAAGTVSMRIEVKEGYEYHMGELQFRGLDNSLTAKLRTAWKLRPGDVYDATYLKQYLPEAQKLLPTRMDWECSPHVTGNLRDKTVDVDLIYTVKAPN